MRPSIVGRELEERFEQLFKTQFEVAEGNCFGGVWEAFFGGRGRLYKGPYIQLPLPFRKTKDAGEKRRFAPAMEEMRFAPYVHQVKSFERLGAYESTLVATGTGSGKTECFALPILAHCAKYRGVAGIRAILIYPMNALATDQAKRFAELICTNEGLKGVRVGLYIGEARARKGKKSEAFRYAEVGFDEKKQTYHVITDREKIIQAPPHILLTNYKMLDYMLLRAKAKGLWTENEKSKEMLKYLVVDELHTFDGAQAADLACLLRRLKERLGVEDEAICCVGTSATLGVSKESGEKIRDYAEKVFGVRFGEEALIREDRLTFEEMAAETGEELFKGEFVRGLFAELGKGGARTLGELARDVRARGEAELWEDVPRDDGACAAKICEVCRELSELRATKGRDYPDVRFQYWVRETARLVADVPKEEDGDGVWRPQLMFSDDLKNLGKLMSDGVKYLPVSHCNKCHEAAWVGLQSGEHVDGGGKEIYNAVFGHCDEQDKKALVYLYPSEAARHVSRRGTERRLLCGACRKLLEIDATRCTCGHEHLIPVYVAKGYEDGREAACPFCGSEGSRILFGMRSQTMLSTCISALTTSRDNADRKILAFNDNVQDASFRAGFFGARTWQATFRAHVAQYFAGSGREAMGLREFLEGFRGYLAGRLGDAREQLAELIPQDLKWLNDWRKLKGDNPSEPSERTMKAFYARLKWEMVAELGCGQHLGRSLRRMKILELVARVPEGLDGAWKADYERLAARMIRDGAFEDEAWFEDKDWKKRSILPSLLRRGPFVLKTMECVGIPAFHVSRSVNVRAPGRIVGGGQKRRHVMLDELEDPRDGNVLDVFVQRGFMRKLTADDGTEYWYLPIEAVEVRWHSEVGSEGAKANPFYQQYLNGVVHRVNAAEHTGLLRREEREELEARFKARPSRRWDPNLISATPTLEMGVDIGDLSSVLLCSVPPTAANFVQRLGRSGRKTGSALDITVALAAPHDLYFYRDPTEMIVGNVLPPGAFLDASEILKRQYLAFALGEWILTARDGALPATVGRMCQALDEGREGAFPENFFGWYEPKAEELCGRFLDRLGKVVHLVTRAELTDYACRDMQEATGLCGQIREAIASTRTTLKNYENKQHDLYQQLERVKKDVTLADDKRQELVGELEVELKSLRIFTSNLRGQKVIGWMCDTAGLLPNYAFPEEGIALQSVLWRREVDKKAQYEKIEVVRAASAGLIELVPGAVFYTHGHHMMIDQVDLQRYTKEELDTCQWRLCPACDHIEKLSTAHTMACPRCGAVWGDGGQVRKLLPARQFVTVKQDRTTLNDDSKDQRDPNFYEKRLFFDRGGGSTESDKAFMCEGEGTPFAFEYVRHLILREINFGKKDSQAPVLEANGEELKGQGFQICRVCNKAVAVGMNQLQHVKTCEAAAEGKTQEKPLTVSFYREYHTEALRIFAPFLGEADDTRIYSFMAAIQLGLKEYFHGEVGHLQMEVESQPVKGKDMRQYFLVLYDNVPGGTGYIQQLVEGNGKKIFDVFRAALERLETCACAADPTADGCYHCLYRYRNQSKREALSRREAIRILKSLIEREKDLKKTEVKTFHELDLSLGLVESELERQFILRLGKIAEDAKDAKGSFVVATVRGFLKGWKVKLPGNRVLGGTKDVCEWEIVPQKDLKPEDGVLVASRPDFLFYPLGEGADGVRPVAVFVDGWEYHRDIVADDVIKRAALRAAGYRVWSLTWDDVVGTKGAKSLDASDSVWMRHLADQANQESKGKNRKDLCDKLFHDHGAYAQVWKEQYTDKKQEIDRFVAYLSTFNDAAFCQHAAFEAGVLMWNGIDRAGEVTVRASLPDAFKDFLESGKCAAVKAGDFDAGLTLRADSAALGKQRFCYAICLDDRIQPTKKAWQEFFAFQTYFQFLDEGLLAFSAKSRGDDYWMQLKAVQAVESGAGLEVAWREALSFAEGDPFCQEVLQKLQREKLPPPRMYEDIESAGGEILASPWMHWMDEKVMVVPEGEDIGEVEGAGWTVIRVDVKKGAEVLIKEIKDFIKKEARHG